MSDCLICAKHAAGGFPVLLEGEHAVLSHYPTSEDTPRVYRGHLFVETRRHVTTFAELAPDEAAEVGRLVAEGARRVAARFDVEHSYAFNIGHLVPHLHVHVVPRYPGTPQEWWGGWKLGEWPDAPLLDARGVAELAAELRGL